MNSVHHDVIIYTKHVDKAINKIKELIKESNETIFKAIPNDKYITDKRTYKVINNYKDSRGYRFYEAYIDKSIDLEVFQTVILSSCLPRSDNWQDRIHFF